VFFREKLAFPQDFLIFSRIRMYVINVRPISDILPRMFAVDLELHPCQLGATVIVSAIAPAAAVEKVFQLFPEYLREGRRGHFH